MYNGQIKRFVQFLQAILYRLLIFLSIIKWAYLYKVFEQTCTFEEFFFSFFKDGQVGAKYGDRVSLLIMLSIPVDWTIIARTNKAWTMTELNMYSVRSYVSIKVTYIDIIPSVCISCAPFRHFVLLRILYMVSVI